MKRPFDESFDSKEKTEADLPVSRILTGFSWFKFHRVTSAFAATTKVCLSTQWLAVIFWEAEALNGSSCLSFRFLIKMELPTHSITCYSEGETAERCTICFFANEN